MSGTKKESHWNPLADLKTSLTIVFKYMTISYMALVKITQRTQNEFFNIYDESKKIPFKEINKAIQKSSFSGSFQFMEKANLEKKIITQPCQIKYTQLTKEDKIKLWS
jgi:hypothetical protein